MSDFKAKMYQIVCRLGIRPRLRWGSLQRSPRPPSWILGVLLLRGREGTRGEGREGKVGKRRKRERVREWRGRGGRGQGRPPKWKLAPHYYFPGAGADEYATVCMRNGVLKLDVIPCSSNYCGTYKIKQLRELVVVSNLRRPLVRYHADVAGARL